jgi:hypothetical protein
VYEYGEESMQVTDKGVFFTDYRSASPGVDVSSFTDRDGATLLIGTDALVRMYELCKFDLERRGGWAAVMKRVETHNGMLAGLPPGKSG